MQFAIVPLLGALVYAFTNFLRYLKAGDANGAVTQLIVWGGGIGAVFLVAQTEFASGVPIGENATLATLSGWSLLFVGLMASSLFSFANDALGAIDSSRSSEKPKLL